MGEHPLCFEVEEYVERPTPHGENADEEAYDYRQHRHGSPDLLATNFTAERRDNLQGVFIRYIFNIAFSRSEVWEC